MSEDARAALAAASLMASRRGDIHVQPGDDMHWLALADEALAWLSEQPGDPGPGDLAAILAQLQIINAKLEVIMSEDAAIQAVTADITTQLTALSSLISQVLSEIESNTVQPSTVSALQAAQASLDSTVAGFSTDLNPPAPPAT